MGSLEGWFVSISMYLYLTRVPSATLAGGTFPGPIIKAQKVGLSPHFLSGSREMTRLPTGP